MATRIGKTRTAPGAGRTEPRRKPVQDRSRVTVQALLEAAAQVFETHGYAAVTTNRIAEIAGFSIGTLYQYFPSKEALVIALLEQHIEETLRRMREWVGHMVAEQHSLRQAMADYVNSMLGMHVQRPRLQHILLEETPLPPRIHDLLLDAEHQLVRTMAGFLRTYPEMRLANPEHSAYLVIHATEALTHRFAAHPEDPVITKPALQLELVEMLASYLKAR
jgi:AcrR family transcriptional regulator